MAIVELLTELAPWELINTLFIPFIVIFVILWGILSAIGFFKKNRKINGVIALGITLFLASTDLFPMLSQWMIQLGSMTAVVVFLLIFVGGVIIWGVNRGRDIYFDTSSKGNRLKKLQKELSKEMEKYRKEGNAKKRKNIWKRIDRLEREIKQIEYE